MVKQGILLLALATQLTACGFAKRFWGEAPPPRKTVIAPSEAMPPFENIFSDNDQVALSTLEEWRKSILGSLDKIKGKRKDFLTLIEVESLVRAGLAKLDDDQEVSVARAHAALRVLGFKDGISRDQVVALLDWVKDHRVKGRTFYKTLFKSESPQLTSGILIELVQFIASLIQLGGDDSMKSKEFVNLIEPWIPKNYVHAKNAVEGGVNLIIATFASLCGDRVQSDEWNAHKNGACLRDLIEHFQSAAPVFDFLFNRLNPLMERKKLVAANETFLERMESWMKGRNHPPFETQLVANFAAQLDIPTPYNFFQLTEWLPKLNAESTTKKFSPTFFIDIARLIQNWVSTFNEAVADTKEIDGCDFAEWRKCKFQGEYDTADRLYNDEYATTVRDNNLDFIYKISLYDSVADYLLKAFGGEGTGSLKNEVTGLIGIMVRILDSNTFAQNVILRLQEKPVDLKSTEDSISAIRRQGLSEVAAMAANLIPERKGRRSILKKLMATVYDSSKHPGYHIDRLGITTFIYVFDLVSDLQTQFMRNYDFGAVKEGSNTYIKRRRIMELLPRILHDHFPRIYNECLDWGFERTCGVVFSEVLASPIKGTDLLEPSDMDIISITSILLESMMNRCDRNQDDVLSTNFFDGFDEKSCVLTVSSTLASRLMNANIVENDKKTQTLLKILKWVAPARWAAKVALERGSLKGIGLRAIPVISLVSGPAHLGGVMSLTAEFMDSEKVDAIDAGEMGHHEDAGDELIYLEQLTKNHLPSPNWALRTSAAARLLYGPGMTTAP